MKQSKAGESVYKIASASLSDAGTYKCAAVISAKPDLKDEATMKISVLSMTFSHSFPNSLWHLIMCTSISSVLLLVFVVAFSGNVTGSPIASICTKY